MLDELKVYLRILDNEEDEILNIFLKDGKNYLNKLVGVTLDFEANISARSLLKDYCRYAYNNATEYFKENYREDIFRLQLESAVKEFAKQETSNK